MSTAQYTNDVNATQTNTNEFASQVKSLVHDVTKDWGWVLAAGIVSIVGGVAALMVPVVATGVVGIFLAATLLVVGCFNLAATFFVQKGLKLESFLTGAVQLVIAALMAYFPVASLMTLTVLIAAFLLADGIIRMTLAIQARPVKGWGWGLAGGIASVATSVIVVAALPLSSFWVIGILVGVNLISVGVVRVALALEARKIAKATA